MSLDKQKNIIPILRNSADSRNLLQSRLGVQDEEISAFSLLQAINSLIKTSFKKTTSNF